MTTSTGWVRANLVYDSIQEPPVPGSPLEAVCSFVFVSRQRAEFLKYKALAQAGVNENNKDSIQGVIEELHENMFPDQKQDKICQADKTRELMEKYSQTPIQVTAI